MDLAGFASHKRNLLNGKSNTQCILGHCIYEIHGGAMIDFARKNSMEKIIKCNTILLFLMVPMKPRLDRYQLIFLYMKTLKH